jgi:hypothetical protein
MRPSGLASRTGVRRSFQAACSAAGQSQNQVTDLDLQTDKEATMAVLHPSPPFDDLMYYPISRWIRGTRGQDTIVDSQRALLVWEPGKKVPI